MKYSCLLPAKFVYLLLSAASPPTWGAPITVADRPAQLDIRQAGEHSLRITLKPVDYPHEFPPTPALVDRDYPAPQLSLRELDEPQIAEVGTLQVRVTPEPLTISIRNAAGKLIQELKLNSSGHVDFRIDEAPILGMGEGGPVMPRKWREEPIEFDRRGRFHKMRPRWQNQAYGSRNPVAFLIGTSGWGLYFATPWGEIDLRDASTGTFQPWTPPQVSDFDPENRRERGRYVAQVRGRPPVERQVEGVLDIFVFDAAKPEKLLAEVAAISGAAAMPPKWALGYMQSHRTLEDETQMIEIVDTFREKQIPLDAVIYLGTGFCPRGWNTEQPSLKFNPEVFEREPAEVIADLHARHVQVVMHVVPEHRDKLPTLTGTIPPAENQAVDSGHIATYWQRHLPLVAAGVDGFWPDEGDWFNLFERLTRHRLYFEGPLSSEPDLRPWSLHRNGHLGSARWGAWVWSGDTDSAWKTLEGQIAVGLNSSLSLSPYWGSDIGGFYPSKELTGELYARWFQFGAFCPSFRSHGRTWWTRLPWGWGLSELGPLEGQENPLESELNNSEIEPVCRQYAELRMRLMPYTYTLARQATDRGLPFMRAMWLHYPDDATARGLADQYLWGEHLLVAPVYEQGATARKVYLPAGQWHDWWSGERHQGPQALSREVDLKTMPLFVKAGTILPVDPVRQYVDQEVEEPTTLRIYPGASGEFELYEDDGTSQAYLSGQFTRTRFRWNDSQRQLTIESASQSAGAPPRREFRVQLMPDGEIQTVEFGGEPLELSF